MCCESDNECVLEVTMNVFEGNNEGVQRFNDCLKIYHISNLNQIKKSMCEHTLLWHARKSLDTCVMSHIVGRLVRQ